MRVLDIVEGTSVDGPGLRTSVYFAGCSHHCPGCHNPQSWDFSGGREMSVREIMDIIRYNGFNVTFSGGDPLLQPMDELLALAAAIKEEGLTLWIYTGFTIEELMERKKYYDRILALADAVVEGPFIESLRDTALRFRGSSNQRIFIMNGGEATLLQEHP